MKLFALIKKFNREEDGAVTVDWVVLTAAVVGLGVVALGTIRTQTTDLSDAIGDKISSHQSILN
jgi:Flp pilus assembly pilin Flp